MIYWINKTKNMKKISQLVKTLSASEVKMIRKYYSISPKIEYNLKIKLFDIALKNEKISDVEAAKLLGKHNNAAFSMLKSRLHEDIMKVLIVEGKDKIFTTSYYRARHKVHYMMLESDILDSRNLSDLANETLIKARRIAQKYELVNDLIVINDMIINAYHLKRGPASFKRMRTESIKELSNADKLFWGTDFFKQITMPTLYSTNKNISTLDASKLAIDNLAELTKDSDVSRLQYFYLRAKILYNMELKNYRAARKYSIEFQKFIQCTEPLNSSDNNGGAHMLIGVTSLYLHQFASTIKYAYGGLDYFYKDSNNQVSMYELVFHASFYKKDYNKAKEIVDYVKGIKTIKAGSFLYSKWLYFNANIEFATKDPKSTLKTLKRHSFLKTDKSGWRLGYRILELISLLELENYDVLPYRLETFRKLLSSISKENVTRPKAMLLLMNRLVKSNFDFKMVSEKMHDTLQLLRDGKDNYAWDMRGYEIIKFDEWWDGKLKLMR